MNTNCLIRTHQTRTNELWDLLSALHTSVSSSRTPKPGKNYSWIELRSCMLWDPALYSCANSSKSIPKWWKLPPHLFLETSADRFWDHPPMNMNTMNKSLLFPWILPFFPGIFVGNFLTASAERRAVRRDWRAALHPVDLRHPGFGDVPTRHDAGHDLVICSTGIPKNGWFMSEYPMKMDDLEVPPCQGTSIWGVLSKIVIWSSSNGIPRVRKKEPFWVYESRSDMMIVANEMVLASHFYIFYIFLGLHKSRWFQRPHGIWWKWCWMVRRQFADLFSRSLWNSSKSRPALTGGGLSPQLLAVRCLGRSGLQFPLILGGKTIQNLGISGISPFKPCSLDRKITYESDISVGSVLAGHIGELEGTLSFAKKAPKMRRHAVSTVSEREEYFKDNMIEFTNWS